MEVPGTQKHHRFVASSAGLTSMDSAQPLYKNIHPLDAPLPLENAVFRAVGFPR